MSNRVIGTVRPGRLPQPQLLLHVSRRGYARYIWSLEERPIVAYISIFAPSCDSLATGTMPCRQQNELTLIFVAPLTDFSNELDIVAAPLNCSRASIRLLV